MGSQTVAMHDPPTVHVRLINLAGPDLRDLGLAPGYVRSE